MWKGNYKKLPNRKKTLLTKKFLKDLKLNIITRAKENDKKQGREEDDYSKYSYSGFYNAIEGTRLFYDALYDTCKKHNVVNAIYNYCNRMEWYDSDCFEADIMRRMIDFGLIEYENELDEPVLWDDEIKYTLTHHYKGYSVSEYGYWDKDDKEGLESIYSDVKNLSISWVE